MFAPLPEWSALFGLTLSPWELVIRGTVMYWFLFLLFRFVLRRDVGALALADVLMLVVIADASQNAMAGSYQTITEGCILVGTIAGWNYALDWAAYRWERVARFVEGQPVQLVRRGRMLRRNMRRELVSTADLMAALRENGIEHLREVKSAVMENDGQISILRMRSDDEGGNGGGTPPRRHDSAAR